MRIRTANVLAGLLLGGLAASSAACGDGAASAVEPSSTSPLGPGDAGPPEAAVDAFDAVDGGGDSAPLCKISQKYGSSECMQCVGTKCCGPITACEADATCKTLQSCVLDCLLQPATPACVDACGAAHPEAKALWAEVESCWIGPKLCLGDCGWTP
ncbi:hypothetical protein BH11MYX4_BH11MYX4_62410 [soil metagenome]